MKRFYRLLIQRCLDQHNFSDHGEQGFSLIELMVAVGIMGGLTTVAVPQYGKYKVKAAHTEVKATFSNIHAAQALYMVDKNEYAAKLTDLDVPTPGGTYFFGNKANLTADDDNFNLTKADGTADKSRFYIYATAKKKLAGCSSAATAPFDAWCLDYKKHMSNDNNQRGECATGGAATKKLVNGGAGC